ncbi:MULTISPECIES: PTS sugar transporter subunit IIA [Lacticaseibacillus]|jgi:PTS system mannose-specific IIA component|uniref:PTS N-acetylglucosamine transporter subunit IIBC n=5 Tax=Lacticaseibacillus TaxID=2759736 RepID=A0AAN1C6E4_LACCA|nr:MULTISPECIES: PTS N-acetylglucosamine transporter subunit IIBC [Lacticaseibacillus]ARY90621.1 PTS N-acetylglucosamine transporter subunit IIBC [Lacticaseibacillus casei]KAB1970477.1 PTS N-acetylglucosamine transporter subunit IIBC [Lacticaseibacillus casei]MBI6598669.1 PTS N-acetylglucosamine transporter subunit IIBC [Lacticaseibacillus casei]MBO1482343.1 PTS N-acetylglucosamine transporter subunit IIBC [Lacticaseibacillus casei]MBO2417596.1 PTS N-acetylglucosamine transporter subunit IIBC 
MERTIVLASHHRLAEGLKDTLNFISGGGQDIVSMAAYLDNQPVENQVDALMASFPADRDVIVLTDMMAGSVNQKFFKYRTRPHTHIISGMNLPLALGIAMAPTNEYVSDDQINDLIQEAKNAIVNVNTLQVEADDDDE